MTVDLQIEKNDSHRVNKGRRIIINGVEFRNFHTAEGTLGMVHGTISRQILQYGTNINTLMCSGVPYACKVLDTEITMPGSHCVKCVIDDVEYDSYSAAARAMGTYPQLIRRRCMSDEFPNWIAVS